LFKGGVHRAAVIGQKTHYSKKVDGKVLVRSIIRKSTNQSSDLQSLSSGVRRNGAYIDYDQKFDGANMMQEIFIGNLGGEKVTVAFAADAGPRLICI
jgi:hypothetical protein